MLSKPSNECASAGLNCTEVHRGHAWRAQSTCGSQVGQYQFTVFISSFPTNNYRAIDWSVAAECASSHASKQRMLPVAMAMQESAAP